MRTRFAALAASMALLSAASAQESGIDATATAMFEAANEVVESVAQGGGFVSRMMNVDRAELMLFPFEDAQRENWQFWPTARVGLPLEYMSAAERRATHDLLASALSSSGYLRAVHIMQLEQILDMLDEGGLPRSVDHYVLVVFGQPSMTEPWAWRFEGHHLSLNVVASPDGITVTPSFFGANPAQVVSGPLAGFRVHGELEDLGRDLVNSLSSEQAAAAILSERAPSEIATANMNKPAEEWDDWKSTVVPIGVQVTALNEVQQHWIRLMLQEIMGNYDEAIRRPYQDGLDWESLRFAWMGSTERGQPHYFRLQGEDFLFEFDNVQNNGNHVHSVWRSKSGDFGANVLAQHYQAAHRP
ncbi:MAG: DUF3500 domain-containing protein [Gammaproteobacteria bacterium]